MKQKHAIIALEALIVLSLLLSFSYLAIGKELMIAFELALLLAFFYLLFFDLMKSIKKDFNYFAVFFSVVYFIAQLPWLFTFFGFGLNERIPFISIAFAVIVFLSVLIKTVFKEKLSFKGK